MDSDQVIRYSATELRRMIVTKELSPVELTETYLERIERFDEDLRAYITVTRREALQAARAVEEAIMKNKRVGALVGLPLAVKDQFKTKGVRTTGGSKVLSEYVPDEDATVIAKAKSAGAILLGKLNMHEFAAGGGDHSVYGEPKNPWDTKRMVGTSSTGSAVAMAASLCAITLGEDTGGSIRAPAAYTGIVGLKPTWGRVSRFGMLPLSWSMDVAGPMTRTVEDAALVLGAIAGYDELDAFTSKRPVPDYEQALLVNLDGLRIGLLVEFMNPNHVHPEILQAMREAVEQLESLGARVEEISLPLAAQIGVPKEIISGTDGAFVAKEWLRDQPENLGPNYRRRMLANSLIPAQVLQKALRVQAIFSRQWLRLFEKFDALISPTILAPAEEIKFQDPFSSREEAQNRFGTPNVSTVAATLAGTPAMSVPCGFSAEGLPIGLQIMTSHFEEELMLRIGYAYEQSTSWHTHRPNLARSDA